jgi:hypothetical protein
MNIINIAKLQTVQYNHKHHHYDRWRKGRSHIERKIIKGNVKEFSKAQVIVMMPSSLVVLCYSTKIQFVNLLKEPCEEEEEEEVLLGDFSSPLL